MPSPFPDLPPERRGTITRLHHHFTSLEDNWWGDPAGRDVWVYTPPGAGGTPLPAVLFLSGFAGTGEAMLARGLSEISLATRIDRLIDAGCPPFVAVLPDCMTRLGGSQFVDSPAIGRYATWAGQELPAFVESVLPLTGRWAVTGRSSGGFGALHLAMTFPGRFSAVACHAGDMGFDLCYLAQIPAAIRGILAAGGLEGFHDGFWAQDRPSPEAFAAFDLLCMACAYSPDLDARPIPARLPFDPATGAPDFDVFRSWGRFDPLQRLGDPTAARALAALDLLFLDAGNKDEYLLHLGCRRFVARLTELGIPFEHEEFPGGHRGTVSRYDVSLPKLARALHR